MSEEVGKGKVPIEADVSGLSKDLASKMKGQGSEISKIFGGVGKAAGAALVGAAGLAIGAFAGLAKLGESFDDAYDHIRITTGKTGDDLAALQKNFKDVVSSVPVSFGDASTAVAGLNQRLGLTGKPLEALSEQMLNLSRLTKTDLSTNIDAATGLFNQWGVSTDQQGTKLDELFRISQQTGVSFATLSQSLSQGGAQFRSAGLSFEESGALLGLLAKNGLDAGSVLPALSKAMATAAKEGKPASQVFKDTFDAIKNAPNDTVAAGDAITVFGAKAGPKFAALIREGKLSYEDFATSIAAGGDTINKAANQTDDWKEKLKLLTNKVLVALEPIASRVFSGLTTVVEKLTPYIQSLAQWFAQHLPNAIAIVKDWIETHLVPVFEKIITVIRDHLPQAKRVLEAIGSGIKTAFVWLTEHKDVLIGLLAGIAAGFVAWGISAAAAALPTIAAAAPIIAVGTAIAAVVAGFLYAYHHFETFHDVVDAVARFLRDTVWPIIKAVFSAIVDAITGTVQWVRDHWSQISDIFESVARFFADNVWPVLKAAFDAVVTAIDGVVTAAQWLWTNVLSPLADFLTAAFSDAWTAASVAIDIVTPFVQGLITAATWLWNNVLEPLVSFLGSAFSVGFGAAKGIVRLLGDAFTGMASTGKVVWDTFLSPIADFLKIGWAIAWGAGKTAIGLVETGFGAVKLVAQDVWDNFLSPIVDFLQGAWNVGWSGAQTAIGLVQTAFDEVRTVIEDVWHNFMEPIGNFLKSVWNEAWSIGAQAIDDFKAPIQWVVDKIQWILNNASKLGDIYNELTGKVTGTFVGTVTPSRSSDVGGHAQGALATGFSPQLAVWADNPGGEAIINKPTIKQLLAWAGQNTSRSPVGTYQQVVAGWEGTRAAPDPMAGFPDTLTLVVEGTPLTAIVQKYNDSLASAITAGARR